MQNHFLFTKGERNALKCIGFIFVLIMGWGYFAEHLQMFSAGSSGDVAFDKQVQAWHSSRETSAIDYFPDRLVNLPAPVEWPEKTPGKKFRDQHDTPFDPNTANREELIRSGISPGIAQTLINYRKTGAVFCEPSDLLQVYHVDEELLQKIKPRIRIEKDVNCRDNETSVYEKKSEQPPTLCLNQADSTELIEIPGIGEVLSGRIVRYRYLLDGFQSVDQLRDVYGLSNENYERMKPYLIVNESEK